MLLLRVINLKVTNGQVSSVTNVTDLDYLARILSWLLPGFLGSNPKKSLALEWRSMSHAGHHVSSSSSDHSIEAGLGLQCRGTILLVEDEDPLRESLEDLLRSSGYAVISVADGTAALTLAEEGVEFDFVLTDVSMPGAIDGMKLASAIQILRPEMPVLYMSGYAEDAIRNSCSPNVAGKLVSKPYTLRELNAMLTKMRVPNRVRSFDFVVH